MVTSMWCEDVSFQDQLPARRIDTSPQHSMEGFIRFMTSSRRPAKFCPTAEPSLGPGKLFRESTTNARTHASESRTEWCNKKKELFHTSSPALRVMRSDFEIRVRGRRADPQPTTQMVAEACCKMTRFLICFSNSWSCQYAWVQAALTLTKLQGLREASECIRLPPNQNVRGLGRIILMESWFLGIMRPDFGSSQYIQFGATKPCSQAGQY